MNTAAPMTTALIKEPSFVTATQLHSRHSFNSTQHESLNSTARLELNQPIDSFDTVALKDFEQVNGGSDVLDQVNAHYRCHYGPVNSVQWSQRQLLMHPSAQGSSHHRALSRRCSHTHPYGHLREQLCEQRRRNRQCDGENISIDMTVIIVTTSAATLDYGIVIEVEIVIVAMHVIADATDRAAHHDPAVRRTTAMVAASRLGVGFAVRIITDPVITFAMAATFVTETNTRTVLNGSTAARVLRASVLHMTVAHVKERPRYTFTNLSQRDGNRYLTPSAT